MSDIDQRLAEIEARANAATPGPWYALDHSSGGVILQASPDEEDYLSSIIEDGDFAAEAATVRTDDGAFIAAAREDVPWLIAQLREANDVRTSKRRN